MLKRVSELPGVEVRRRRESMVAKDVREFCRNQTYDVAEVVIEGKSGKTLVDMIKKYITTHPEQCEGVKAAVRHGRAYLYREVQR